MFKGTFSIATSLLKLHTYKAMGVPQHCKGRNKYCRWFQQTVFNLYRPNGATSVPANVLLFGQAVQRLYRCVIPLLKALSKHKFKTIVLSECLEFFYWLLRLSEIDF
jgi:hypothetical protein